MKIIHQIWIGPHKKPDVYLNSWKDYIKHNPDWKYILWTDKEINNLKIINQDIYNKENTLRGKADIARYEILYQYGGLYIDADSLCINPKRSLNVLIENTTFFAGREPKNKKFIANGVIYCSKNNKIIYKMINHLKNNYYSLKKKYPKNKDIWLVTNQPTFSNICNSNNVTIYPPHFFYPEGFIRNKISISLETIRDNYQDSYMYHFWLSHLE